MRTLVKSLKRLYDAGRLSNEQIAERLESGSISKEEYQYITGEAYEHA